MPSSVRESWQELFAWSDELVVSFGEQIRRRAILTQVLLGAVMRQPILLASLLAIPAVTR